MKFVIEHLDPEVWDWRLVEYKHIAAFAGKEQIIFTNVKKGAERLAGLGEVHAGRVDELNLKNACVLDPKAEKTLSPEDAFDYLIIGGVLGNHPMDGRTEKEITSRLPFPARNLGDVQMSTNTAAYVAWKISQGKRFEEFEFVEELVIPIQKHEEVELPFRFVVEDGKVVLPDDYYEMVKEQHSGE